MNTTEMCAYLGRAHEFFLVLKKAGFTDELIKEIINSPGNAKAKKMFAALNEMFNLGSENAHKNRSALGSVVTTFNVEATTTDFVVGKNFVVDTGQQALIDISYLGENFVNSFSEKIEEPLSDSTVFGRDLKKCPGIYDILVELGGIKKAEIKFGEIYQMMRRQSSGGSGSLINNGIENIFFVSESCVIYVRWTGLGWVMNEWSYKIKLQANARVFSHSADIQQTSKIVVKKAIKNDVGPIELIPNDDSYFLPESDGSQLIYQATDVFKLGIDKQFVELGLDKPGIFRPKTAIEGRNIYFGSLVKILSSFPGSWEDKWLTQNQAIDYCRKFAYMHGSGSGGAIFLIKKDENIPIDEEDFFVNLSIVNVKSARGGLFVDYIDFESAIIKKGTFAYQIITPKLLTK